MLDSLDPLSQLRDIHEPPSPFFPPGPGWWLLLISIIAATLLLRWRWQVRQFADPRHAALRELADLRRRHAQGEATGTLVSELATLLRRVALLQFPRAQVASLHGHRWLEFLERQSETHGWFGGVGECLAWAPYVRNPHVDIAALLALSESSIPRLADQAARRRVSDRYTAVFRKLASTYPSAHVTACQLAFARRRVHAACSADNATAARGALLRWARLRWPGSPPRGLQELAARLNDPGLASAVDELDASLYAANTAGWQGRGLWRRARRALESVSLERVPGKGLPELYK